MPLSERPPFLRAAAALLEGCGRSAAVAALPSEIAFTFGFKAEIAPGVRLSWRDGICDPYAGGDRWSQEISVTAGSGPGAAWARLEVAEVAWVGEELRLVTNGPPGWAEGAPERVEAACGIKLGEASLPGRRA